MYNAVSCCLQPKREIEHICKVGLWEKIYGTQSLKSLWTNKVKLF